MLLLLGIQTMKKRLKYELPIRCTPVKPTMLLIKQKRTSLFEIVDVQGAGAYKQAVIKPCFNIVHSLIKQYMNLVSRTNQQRMLLYGLL